MKVFKKSDEDIIDYDIILTDWLPTGDTIDNAVVTADAGISIDSTETTDDRVKIWVSGGTSGNTYNFKVLASTVGNRRKEINFLVAVTEI